MTVQSKLAHLLRSLLVNEFVATLGQSLEYGRWEFRYRKYRQEYEVHPTFKFDGTGIIIYGDGRIVLGERSFIGRYSSIAAGANCEVMIGRNCSIGPYVMIYAINMSPDQDLSKTRIRVAGNVRVEDNCWIGARVFINQGVSIGNNSVIGANSVVTRDIPPHSIAVGAPAKVTRFKSYIDKTEIFELAKTYWPSLNPTLKQQLLQTHPELKSSKYSATTSRTDTI